MARRMQSPRGPGSLGVTPTLAIAIVARAVIAVSYCPEEMAPLSFWLAWRKLIPRSIAWRVAAQATSFTGSCDQPGDAAAAHNTPTIHRDDRNR